MQKFYSSLSTSKKIILIAFTLPLFTLLGGSIGFICGLFAINFIPDVCTIQGIMTGCRNPFEFNGLVGWEGTSLLGLYIGITLFFILYLCCIVRWELHNHQ